jgi:hypothetical protein
VDAGSNISRLESRYFCFWLTFAAKDQKAPSKSTSQMKIDSWDKLEDQTAVAVG